MLEGPFLESLLHSLCFQELLRAVLSLEKHLQSNIWSYDSASIGLNPSQSVKQTCRQVEEVLYTFHCWEKGLL
jgi:hypothetical protein